MTEEQTIETPAEEVPAVSTEQTTETSGEQTNWRERIVNANEKLGLPMPPSALDALVSNPTEAEQHHKDLTAMISKGQHKPAGELKIETPADKPIFQDDGEFDAQAWAAKAGLDFQELYDQAMTEDGLPDDTYKQLAKATGRSVGETKAIVEGRVAKEQLRISRDQKARDEAVSVIGGYERWEQEIQPWLQQHVVDEKYTAAEIADLNSRLSNPQLAKSALRDIEAKFKLANPPGRPEINGTPTPGGGQMPTNRTEMAELTKKMNNGDEAARRVFHSLTNEQISRINARSS